MLAKLEPHKLALLRAAEYMREHGKCSGEMVDLKGRVCMLGAIHFATQGEGFQPCIATASASAIAEYLGADWQCVAPWNDRHSEAECIAALEGAALS